MQNLAQITQETIDLARKAAPGGDLHKAITSATGITGYSLEAPSKKLFPVLTPLRNRIPRVMNPALMGATATNWKAITAINSAGRKGGAAEGYKGAGVTTTVASKTATYKTIALSDSVTFQGIWAGRNFEDVRATAGVNLLYATMLEEEYYDLGGNASITLAAPGAPTLTAAAGGSLANAKIYVKAYALTLQGYLGKTDKDGNAIGIGQTGTAANTTPDANQKLTAVITTPVDGAVAYAWYTSLDGAAYCYNQTTTTTTAVITAHDTEGAAPPSSASGADADGYDGILTQAYASGSGAIIGTPATFDTSISDGKLTKTAIDQALIRMWNASKVQPTVIWANATDHLTITNKILAAAPTQNVYLVNTAEQRQNIIGGTHAAQYISPVTGQIIEVKVHPYLPQGTILGKAEVLPYPNNQVPSVVEKELRLEYAQFDWAVTDPQYNFSVMLDGVLKDYFPAGSMVIRNITQG